jgi:beta-galactosidase
MGNGPGNIKEYIDAFYKYPTLQGGFAWEWANHGLINKDKETGEEYFAYGGDFGEVPHDSTFVMDGLVHSDHTPTPGLTEYKKAIEPVQFVSAGEGKAKFINRYDFISLDHLSCYLSAVSDGQSPSHGERVNIPLNVAPGQTFEISLVGPSYGEGEVIVNVSFQLKEGTPWLEAGFEVATAQIPLRESNEVRKITSSTTTPFKLNVSATSRHTVQIRSNTNAWAFNTLHGTLTSWVKGSVELISKAPEINFYRAPTDNDIPQDGWDWKDKLLHLAKPSTRKTELDIQDTEAVITVHQRVAPPVLSWSINCVLSYRFTSDGLAIKAHGTPQGTNLPRTLPRIGLVMELPNPWQDVQWFGRGPGESYRDSKFSQPVGTYNVDCIDDLWVDYEVPQESNRTDTRWLKLRSGDAELLVQFVEDGGKKRRAFDWQASHYRMWDVAEAGHPYQLRRKKVGDVVLRLDAQHHGLGSGSCGPRTLDEYSLLTEEFEFEVLLQ